MLSDLICKCFFSQLKTLLKSINKDRDGKPQLIEKIFKSQFS